MNLSTKGAAAIERHEGNVQRAYRCPAGVVTIGVGYTMRSAAFGAWWRKRHGGRALKMGDTMTRAEALDILPAVADAEYGAAVNRSIAPKRQHHYDGATSVAFNLGPASVKWRWGKALAAGRVGECARLLRNNYNTANGKVLAGLVRRRREEADLIEHGIYGPGPINAATEAKGVARFVVPVDRAERLAVRGFLAASGYAVGADAEAIAADAVRAFQTANGLTADGLVGKATLAKIERLKAAKAAAKAAGQVGGTGGTATAGGAAAQQVEPSALADWILWGGLGLALVAVVVFAVVAWRRGWFDELKQMTRRL